jgi:hypothetical protein
MRGTYRDWKKRLCHDVRVSDDLERLSPRENARNKARDKKARGPKVIAVNPGLKKLALHLATKRRKTRSK